MSIMSNICRFVDWILSYSHALYYKVSSNICETFSYTYNQFFYLSLPSVKLAQDGEDLVLIRREKVMLYK